jgi:hypothetical protein
MFSLFALLSQGIALPPARVLPQAAAARRAGLAHATAVFSQAGLNTGLKMELLTLGASLDRGQSYNPTSSDAYAERMAAATSVIRRLIEQTPPLPTSLAELSGEWELVFTG